MIELQSVLLGILVTTAWQRRKDRRVWARRSDRVLILMATSRTNTGTYGRPVTGLGQARAMGLITPLLTRCYRDPGSITVDLSSFRVNTALEGDLILLGGLKNNEVTRQALSKLDAELPVTMKTTGDEQLYLRTDGSEEPFLTTGGALPTDSAEGADHGLIIRTRNCFDSEGTLTIFAGTHTYGTVAAVRYLLEHESEIASLGDKFVVVVKSFVTAGEHVERPTAVIPPMKF